MNKGDKKKTLSEYLRWELINEGGSYPILDTVSPDLQEEAVNRGMEELMSQWTELHRAAFNKRLEIFMISLLKGEESPIEMLTGTELKALAAIIDKVLDLEHNSTPERLVAATYFYVEVAANVRTFCSKIVLENRINVAQQKLLADIPKQGSNMDLKGEKSFFKTLGDPDSHIVN